MIVIFNSDFTCNLRFTCTMTSNEIKDTMTIHDWEFSNMCLCISKFDGISAIA